MYVKRLLSIFYCRVDVAWSLLSEPLYDLQRQWEEDDVAVLRDVVEGLQEPQLQGLRTVQDCLGCVCQALTGLQLSLSSDHLQSSYPG